MADKWYREAEQVIRDAGLVILSQRERNHRVYKVKHRNGMSYSITISRSPRSTEQAVERLRQELKTRFSNGN